MYTRKDDAIRGVLIPVLVIGVPVGLLAVTLELGVNPNITGLTLVGILVGLVVWRIWVARHPNGWPLPKKVLRSLRAQGFKGYTATSAGGIGLGPDNVDSDKDGFSLLYSNNAGVRASMNEKTRELSFRYERKGVSWLRLEESLRLVIERNYKDGEPLVIRGKPSDFGVGARTSAEKKFARWIGGAHGEQILSLPLTRIYASKDAGNKDPWLSLDLTIPEGTFADVSQVVAGAKELFWKLMGAIEAERTDTWLN